MKELGAVSVRGQERGDDCRPTGNERPASPPNMQAVWRREWYHRRSLAERFDADLGDRQPLLDQPLVGTGRTGRRLLCASAPRILGHALPPLDHDAVSSIRRAAST